ncbi:hypothetical protein M5K25_009201 [Dendrobium thyrsiflorum]|uniref:Uncharacterized protein n=1 Tax=Dendrobium thyrsiflorum TaxID=117978 RepID=A0ABD0V651_DENTH
MEDFVFRRRRSVWLLNGRRVQPEEQGSGLSHTTSLSLLAKRIKGRRRLWRKLRVRSDRERKSRGGRGRTGSAGCLRDESRRTAAQAVEICDGIREGGRKKMFGGRRLEEEDRRVVVAAVGANERSSEATIEAMSQDIRDFFDRTRSRAGFAEIWRLLTDTRLTNAPQQMWFASRADHHWFLLTLLLFASSFGGLDEIVDAVDLNPLDGAASDPAIFGHVGSGLLHPFMLQTRAMGNVLPNADFAEVESAIVASGDSSADSESPPRFTCSICDAMSGLRGASLAEVLLRSRCLYIGQSFQGGKRSITSSHCLSWAFSSALKISWFIVSSEYQFRLGLRNFSVFGSHLSPHLFSDVGECDIFIIRMILFDFICFLFSLRTITSIGDGASLVLVLFSKLGRLGQTKIQGWLLLALGQAHWKDGLKTVAEPEVQHFFFSSASWLASLQMRKSQHCYSRMQRLPIGSWLLVPVGQSLVCSVIPSAQMKGFNAIGEHTGAGHNRNIVMPFGGESPGSEGPES